MAYRSILRGEAFQFADLRELLAVANEPKSGDQLAGIAARDARQRVAAKLALADVTIGEIVDRPVIDPDIDDVSRLILDDVDREVLAEVRSWTIGELRERVLDAATSGSGGERPASNDEWLRRLGRGLTPEVVAAVAKLMSNSDLVVAAASIRNVTRCRNTLGQSNVIGVRIQPNHPTDDLAGIILATLDGLLLGCGDAVIGVNPATDSIDAVSTILSGLDRVIERLQIPTQACCLAHITTQLACLERGVPIDLLFQSIAGTQAANASFGVSLSLLDEGRRRVLEQHASRTDVTWVGEQVMYFETGQGSALSAESHHGVDQLTIEARAYGVARRFDPFLVNTVVGFIGPEYLYDERQIVRAGLEDHFMGKLLGLPMGCDVCYTNHADADQNSADNLLVLLAAAGCNYFMGVPCADDVMLNYQSTSYHDLAKIRDVVHARPAPEFLAWLEKTGIFVDGRLSRSSPELLEKLAARVLPRITT